MRWKVMAPVLAVLLVVVGLGCLERDAPPGPGAPTLSLAGAHGVTADLRRTVREFDGARDTVLSVVDTAVWAPFDEHGAAIVASDASGVGGPVGWLDAGRFAAAAWTRYGHFVDSAGVTHELRLEADGGGPWNRMEYVRGGRLVWRQWARWRAVDGGWVLDAGADTYLPDGGSALEVELEARGVHVARRGAGARQLAAAAGLLGDWAAPRPLAAQFHFGACADDWLKWIGTALLADLAWGRFLSTRRPSDFQKALAATAAAGVALSGLVDCMLEQPEQLDPGR